MHATRVDFTFRGTNFSGSMFCHKRKKPYKPTHKEVVVGVTMNALIGKHYKNKIHLSATYIVESEIVL